MAIRFYSNVAPPTSLTAGVNTIATTITIDSAAGLPTFQPFTLALDPDTPTMELVEVTAAAGTTLTVTRAIDGTSASSHSAGAVVMHVSSARDFAEANAHINATTNVHGLSGGAVVVGTTSSQTLTNKTLTSPTINGGTYANGTINTATVSSPTLTGTVAGSPTFSGNPTFSGGPIVSGTLNVNGTLQGTGIGVSRYAFKSANETRTSATLADDGDLTVPIGTSSGHYMVEAFLAVRGDPNADFNNGWSIPTNAIGIWAPINYNTGATGNSGPVEIVASNWTSVRSYGLHPDGTSIYGIHIKGGLMTVGFGGNLTFRWSALNGGGTGTTLLLGSWLAATRIG